MKKIYRNPTINIDYFNGERIRTTEVDPVLISGVGNYQDANSWISDRLAANGSKAAGVLTFTD